jgi:hypothetical protein
MAATKENIKKWIVDSSDRKMDYMIVVCDQYDYENFPVFVTSENLHKEAKRYGRDMHKVMEIYDLNGDIEAQLDMHRAFPPGFPL